MRDMTARVRDELFSLGADLVGFGDLAELPTGISVAVKYDKEAIRGIHEMPTRAYLGQCHELNRRLDAPVTLCGRCIEACPYTRRYLGGST